MTGSGEVLERLAIFGVIPVVEVEGVADAMRLASVLIDAGLPIIELTLRTPAALEAIQRVAAECPDLCIGAGTVLDADMVKVVSAAGARFGVSPGLSRSCLAAAADEGLPFVPGVVTPTDVLTALDAGARHLKFFPAAANGGTATLAALAGPFAPTGVRFMPTGGVSTANAADYLELPSVFAVGGTWIAPRADITDGRWDDISERARGAVQLVRSLRAGTSR